MFSVIIPLYNGEKNILKAIESVINQTYFSLILEIIVVNDGSTDNSKLVVEKFMKENPYSKIKLLNKKNGGVSSARNYGIKNSSGSWIALLDSDDYWLSDKIEKQFKVLKKHKEIVFLGGGRNKENVKFGKKIGNNLYKLTIKDLLKKYWPHTSTALIKRDILFIIGLYDESRSYAEDGQLWLKIASKYDLYYICDTVEIAGNNKRSFGEKGLSANLAAMHKGVLDNINEVYDRKEINYIEKNFYRILEIIKYIRRIIITRFF